jgi:acyl-CoA synthetase (AMP-forming)/AMP-acid ligase II
VAKGDAVLIHSENCPEMVLSWLACATLGAVAVTTNTKSVGAEVTYFAEHTRATAAITQPQYAAMVASAAPALKWIAVTEDNSGEPATPAESAHGFDAFDTLFADAAEWTTRAPEPMLPFGIMFTSGTTSRPKAVVHTHANAIWASRTGPRNIDLAGDDTYLIYLPFFHVNAQSWSLFSVFGVGATAVLMPKWSQSRLWPTVVEHGVTHISVMPFVMGALGTPDRPAEHTLRVGVFGLIMPDLDKLFGIGVRGLRHDRDRHALRHGQAQERLPTLHGPRHAGAGCGGRQGDRRAVRRGRDRRAVDAGPAGSSSSSSTTTTTTPTRRSQTAGSRLRHGEDGRGRQRLLPGAYKDLLKVAARTSPPRRSRT